MLSATAHLRRLISPGLAIVERQCETIAAELGSTDTPSWLIVFVQKLPGGTGLSSVACHVVVLLTVTATDAVAAFPDVSVARALNVCDPLETLAVFRANDQALVPDAN